MAKSPSSKPVEELSYELALGELERIVTALEGEQNPLEETLSLFERGQALIRHCEALLDQAEVKVKQLAGDALVDFENEE
jgi:exodeoxyribonuclease VII small subunit